MGASVVGCRMEGAEVRGVVGVPEVFTGHTDHVMSVVMSADGSRIVSGSYDNTIRVWDVVSGREVAKLEGHTSGVRSVVMSVDGSRIVSGSDDMTIRVWDVESGREVAKLEGHTDSVSCVVMSVDGSRIVT